MRNGRAKKEKGSAPNTGQKVRDRDPAHRVRSLFLIFMLRLAHRVRSLFLIFMLRLLAKIKKQDLTLKLLKLLKLCMNRTVRRQ